MSAKLFVGCIPNYVTELMLKEKFSDHGTIVELVYVRDQVLTDRGWAFITYQDDTEAACALALINNTKVWGGAPRDIQVKFVNTKVVDVAGTAFDPNWQPQEACTPWEELRTEDGKPYYYNHLTEETVWDRPRAMMERPALIIPQATGSSNGPPGANLFVYGIPNIWTDFDLNAHFKKCGQLLVAKVHVDMNGLSKGFGFVSYTTVNAATEAIKEMHGYDCGDGKFLRVSVKKGEEAENPDGVAAAAQKSLQLPRANLVGQGSLSVGPASHAPQGLDAALNAISFCYNPTQAR